MRLFAIICIVLMGLSATARAQDSDGSTPLGGVSPGMLALGAVGVGLATWAIIVATKKNSSPTPLTCAQNHPSTAATSC
jgi:hypothetical protein